jgi:hypothetical protein
MDWSLENLSTSLFRSPETKFQKRPSNVKFLSTNLFKQPLLTDFPYKKLEAEGTQAW